MVCLASAMLVEERANRARIQEAGISRARRRPRFVGEITEAADKPIRKRHLESELPAFRPFGREPGFDCLPEYIFAGVAAQLELARNGQRPIDEAV